LPAAEKTVHRLADEGNILIGAGSETTAQVLSVMFYHLISNPSVLDKLKEELLTVMPQPETEVSWEGLEKLPYLVSVKI
jgi:cytochrome P450